MELDEWQREVIAYEGNIALRSGRQVGKSTAIAIKVGEYAFKNSNKSVMVISATERQAFLLFSKILGYLLDNYKTHLKSGKERPTKSEIKLKNGTIIRCLPTGLDGIGIRGYTVDILIADEAHYIPEDVWPAVTPMLATTGGTIILLSTPRGSLGYFYERFNDPSFKTWHINAEEVANARKEPQRSYLLANLENERKRMTRSQFAQEYLGEFLPNVGQYLPDALIKGRMLAERPKVIYQKEYYMGVDIARMGGDECTFEIFQKVEKRLVQVENIAVTNILAPDTIKKILDLDTQYNFQKIYIDTGGMGSAIFDFLLRENQTRRKVISIDNATRPVERKKWDKEPRKKILMKEHLYVNLKVLMEQGYIDLLKDEDLFFSLKSVQVDEEGKFFGEYTHIAEGIIRAAWSSQEKNLNLWIERI